LSPCFWPKVMSVVQNALPKVVIRWWMDVGVVDRFRNLCSNDSTNNKS
jgi:hypothetical protein